MSSPGDPYAVLGLATDATEKQIKTAFRALAKECHPDVAGEDPAKIQRFKDLRAAYELLVDPARRAAWDRRVQRREGNPFVGSHWRNAGKPAPGSKGTPPGKQDLDLEDIFNDFGGIDFGFGKKAPTSAHSSGPAPRAAGGGPAPRTPSNAPSSRTNSAPTGRPRPTVNQWNPVDDFRKAAEEGSWPGADGEGGASQGFNGNGKGSRPTSRPIPSTGWHHQGRSRPESNVKPTGAGRANRPDSRRQEPEAGDDIEIQVDVPADVAHRGGLVELNYPRFVRGDDQELHEIPELHELRVPPGVHEGERLRVDKQGHAGEGGGPYGDLIATVHLISARSPVEAPPGATDGPRMKMPKAEAPVVVGQAATIVVDVRVSEAILGGRVELETPQGRVRISVPPGTSSGTRLRLRGRGAAGADGQPTDAFAEIRIVVPKDLDDESRALIERFSELNPGE